MLSSVADLYRKHPIAQVAVLLRHRGITVRHITFGAVIFFFLWTSYYTFVYRRSLPLPSKIYAAPSTTSPEEWKNRAEQVKAAFVYAYHGYEEYAWGFDELKPMTNTSTNNFNGWGVTIIDSLDTMYLMGLHDEFKRALPFVEQATFSLDQSVFAPFFETVIRYLGGLLSAYALSREPILLTRADDLGRLLAPAFNTQSTFPAFSVSTATGVPRPGEVGSLAEIASCQMEYMYLAKQTGKKEYFELADSVNKQLMQANLTHLGGMAPTRWSTMTGEPFDYHLSVGAMADSAHEYLLKQYLMTAKTDKKSLEMYIRTTTQILTSLFYLSPTRHLLYVTDTFRHDFVPTHTFEHLSCFLPGLLALGAHTLPLDNLASLGINLDDLAKDLSPESKAGYAKLHGHKLSDIHLWAAEGLAQSCYLTYADQPSRMGPDEVVMFTSPDPGGQRNLQKYGGGQLWIDAMGLWKRSGARGPPPGLGPKRPVIYTEADRMNGVSQGQPLRDYAVKRTGYILRPETLESLYILWRVTGDPQWREYGWSIFEAIERQTKTNSGYASLRDVQYVPAIQSDSMPSFFLAETLKYLYLMFTEEDLVPLDKYVFNTEGHPFSVFAWTEQEKMEWGIQ